MCLFKPETSALTSQTSESSAGSGGSKADARRRNVKEKKSNLEEMLKTAAAASKAASLHCDDEEAYPSTVAQEVGQCLLQERLCPCHGAF
mmetsp:Transcript_124374/g.175464  ORF Transcript_124374/g.175464 Transcript_124374/m.175464 type:complete len:90 (-) Transcript_124374:251-520(-)